MVHANVKHSCQWATIISDLLFGFFFTVPSTNKRGGSSIRLIQLFILLGTFHFLHRIILFLSQERSRAYSLMGWSRPTQPNHAIGIKTSALPLQRSSPRRPTFHCSSIQPEQDLEGYRVMTHGSSIFHSRNYCMSHAICWTLPVLTLKSALLSSTTQVLGTSIN